MKKKYEKPQADWHKVVPNCPLAQSGLMFSVHGLNNELNAGDALSRQVSVW